MKERIGKRWRRELQKRKGNRLRGRRVRARGEGIVLMYLSNIGLNEFTPNFL